MTYSISFPASPFLILSLSIVVLPFPRFVPLSDCLVVCTSIKFISMCPCERSKLNAPKPHHFNQVERRPYLRKKHGQKLVDGDERAFHWVLPDERVCSHMHTNACISRGVPADRMLSSAECKLTEVVQWNFVWLHLCKNLKVWLCYSSRSHISTVLELHPFDVKRTVFVK